MRETNFTVGRLQAGYETNYGGQFAHFGRPELKVVDKAAKNKLEASHWSRGFLCCFLYVACT